MWIKSSGSYQWEYRSLGNGVAQHGCLFILDDFNEYIYKPIHRRSVYYKVFKQEDENFCYKEYYDIESHKNEPTGMEYTGFSSAFEAIDHYKNMCWREYYG